MDRKDGRQWAAPALSLIRSFLCGMAREAGRDGMAEMVPPPAGLLSGVCAAFADKPQPAGKYTALFPPGIFTAFADKPARRAGAGIACGDVRALDLAARL